jgi:tetratricopeptide (TPR) repeat protein
MPAPSYSYDRPPWYRRAWAAIKPPPVAARPGTRDVKQARTQRRMLVGFIAAATVAVAGWLVFSYFTTAPQRAEARFQEGMRLMAPATYKEAIGRFDRAISIAPNHARAYFQRGAAKRFLNRIDDALADFSRAAEIDPSLTEAYVARGAIFRDRGETQRGLDEFTRSIQIKPTIDAFYERGQTYELLGDHPKAIEDFDQAIAIMREAPYVYRARALVKLKLGDEAGYRSDRETARQMEH